MRKFIDYFRFILIFLMAFIILIMAFAQFVLKPAAVNNIEKETLEYVNEYSDLLDSTYKGYTDKGFVFSRDYEKNPKTFYLTGEVGQIVKNDRGDLFEVISSDVKKGIITISRYKKWRK